jgi:hypothetical protein
LTELHDRPTTYTSGFFSRFRNVFQVLGHLQVQLIIISRKNENHRIRLDKEYGK